MQYLIKNAVTPALITAILQIGIIHLSSSTNYIYTVTSANGHPAGGILLVELARAVQAAGANLTREVCGWASALWWRAAQSCSTAASRALAGRAVTLHSHSTQSTHLTSANKKRVGKWAAIMKDAVN